MFKKQAVVSQQIRGRVWTEEEEEKLFFMRRKMAITFRMIAVSLNRTDESCRKKYNTTRWETKPFFNKTLDNKLVQNTKEAYLESELIKHEKKIDIMSIRGNIIADRIESSLRSLPLVSEVYRPTKITKGKRKQEEVGVVLSDLHIGQEYSLEETGGIAEYNEQIFLSRLNRLKHSVVDIINLHSKLYDIPVLNIFCLGDIVAGMNSVGKWSNTFINLPVYDQFMKGYSALADMIYYWLGLFPKIRFFGVKGNHGRCASVGVEKDYVNWDMVCYDFLKQRLYNNKQVEFIVPKTWWICHEIQKHKFLVVHGDDIKGGNFPAQSLANFEAKMAGIIGYIPDYTIAGHFHNSAEFTTNHGKTIINGSFIGGDVYSIKDIHASSPAEQKIFGINETRGITWRYDIRLDK